MKRARLFSLIVGMAFGVAPVTFAAQTNEAELMKQAKITKAQAQQIALARFLMER